jgi:hypothetical protein
MPFVPEKSPLYHLKIELVSKEGCLFNEELPSIKALVVTSNWSNILSSE